MCLGCYDRLMSRFDLSPVERALTLEKLVRDHADESDEQRRLPAEVARAFAVNGLYRIGAPKSYGGEEADPMAQIETIETISRFDGAAGWNLMIGVETFGLSAAGCDSCRELIEDPLVILCGSTAAVGRADLEGDGYRVSGQWQFVSGCHNATVFSATVRLYENDKPVSTNVAALITASDFEIQDTWHVGGMRGSGSHDVHVNDVWVPANQIVPRIGFAESDLPLMRFPLAARLAYNKVAVSLGIARAALDAFYALAEGKWPRFSSRKLKERASAHRAIAEAEVLVNGARALLMQEVGVMWQKVERAEDVTNREKALFQITCSHGVRACTNAVDLVCDAAGTSANFETHPLERIGRDIRVVRQHLTVAGHHIEDGGRVLLGLTGEDTMLKGLGGG